MFLYDFFKDSGADHSQWRLVLKAAEEQSGVIQSFIECGSRYAILCTEVCMDDVLY